MTAARLCIEEYVDPALALARGQLCWEACTRERPVSLYAASLSAPPNASGPALVLGAHQHAAQALSPAARSSSRVLRRSTGGASVCMGEGISYLALGLYERSVLMTCPPQRILNRNVRGALHGLRLAGLNAHYFGRDFLSVDVRPAVYAAWRARGDGRVLLELFLGERRSCWPESQALGYPARNEDPFRGKQPITLQEAGAREHGAALLDKIAAGYAAVFACEWQACPTSEAERAQAEQLASTPTPAHPSDELIWSAAYEEAIGFVSAAVALDGAGKLERVCLAGDFFAADGCDEALSRTLRGVEPRPELIGRALDTVFGAGRHELEGVRSLQTFQQAILDSLQRTRAARESQP